MVKCQSIFLCMFFVGMINTFDLPKVEANSSIVVQVGENLQSLVDDHPEGTSFLLEAGVYRMQQISPKSGNSFIGKTGTILSGAKVLKTFIKEGKYWVVSNQTQEGITHGVCEKQADGKRWEGCKFPEDLFIDDKPLIQVTSLSEVESGKWFFDYDQDKIYIGNNPDGKKIETSVTPYAFIGAAHNVTINKIIVEKYATPAQHGAIHTMDLSQRQLGVNWKVQHAVVRLNHGIGIKVSHKMRIINSNIHHNGQLGVGGTGNDVFLENNEIAYNNTQMFGAGWEAGGAKFTKTQHLMIRGNHVHHNKGPGLWTDRDNVASVYENNRILNNERTGIFHLASYSAKIRNNLVEGNGFSFSTWMWGAGILIHSSRDVEVYGNTVRNNADGIAAIQQKQNVGNLGPHVLENLYVHHNYITMLTGQTGLVQDVKDTSYFTSRNNRFEDNIYILGDNRKFFQWNDTHSTWTNWQNFGLDVDGTISVVDSKVQEHPESISIHLGENIQDLVTTHPEGTVFVIKKGIHRLQQVTPKNGNIFIGEPGTILSGAKLLKNFVRLDQYWMVENQDQEGDRRGSCQKRDQGVPRQECQFPEDLFINDIPLLQVDRLAKVKTGKWFFDYDQDKIYIGDNPDGKKIETSVTPYAFQGSAQNVTIRDIVIEKFSNPAQNGAIHGKEGTNGALSLNWNIERAEIRLNHGIGIRTGHRMRITDTYTHHNGQLGIGGEGNDILVQNNEIAYNNTQGFNWDFEAGGAKFVRTKNLLVRGNFVHHNYGCGLWTDLDNVNTLYEGNRVIENTRCGIFHEISHSAIIKNNFAKRNGSHFPDWQWGGGIVVYSSDNVEVLNNIVTENAAGIAGIEQDREHDQGLALLKNLYVHDNLIILSKHTGIVEDRGKLDVYTRQNNRFANNTYILGDRARPFLWMNKYHSESEWQNLGQDVTGTFTQDN